MTKMTIDLSLPNPCTQCGKDLNSNFYIAETQYTSSLCFECYIKRLVAVEIQKLNGMDKQQIIDTLIWMECSKDDPDQVMDEITALREKLENE